MTYLACGKSFMFCVIFLIYYLKALSDILIFLIIGILTLNNDFLKNNFIFKMLLRKYFVS